MPSIWKAAQDALSPIFRPAGITIDGVDPGSWASPQQPIRPTSQLAVGVRQWDFTPGINLQFTPRGDVPVKFGHLWNVSNSFDLCRLLIETRKDQIVNRPWTIRVKARPGEQKAARLKRESSNQDVTAVTALLRKPDGVHSFPIWLRMWLEQLLVFDAPCIYLVKNMLGETMALRLISGATITPLLDQQGFTPRPPDPAYQQIILGIPTGNLAGMTGKEGQKFTVDQLIYSPRNPRVDSRWGFSPVEQIIKTLAIAANRQQFLLDFYTSGNVPEGLLPMPESWTMNQIKDFQKWFDALLAGNLGKRRRLTMIPDAKHPAQFTKHEALTDVTDDYLIRVVAFAFSISPQNLIKQVNRGTAKESSDVAQLEGLEPYLKHIETVINDDVLVGALGKTEIEFAYEDEREMDPLKQAQTDQIYLTTGTYTRNEIREARGDDPRPEKEADVLGVVTANGFVPLDADAAAERAKTMQPEPEPDALAGGKASPVKVRKQAIKVVAGELTPRSRQLKQEFHRQLTKFLSAQRKRIAKKAREEFAAMKSFEPSLHKGDLETDTDRAAAILALLDWQYPALAEIAKPYLVDAAREGVNAGAYQMAAHGGASLSDVAKDAETRATVAATNRAYEMAGLKVEDDGTIAEATGPHWAISTTAKDDTLATIKQAIKEDWSPAQLEAVLEASKLFTSDHAETIADSEISHQQVQGHITAWRVSGKVLEYAWQVADLGCCLMCAEFSAQGSVPVGHDFGMGIYEPGAHPECRCWLVVTKLAEE